MRTDRIWLMGKAVSREDGTVGMLTVSYAIECLEQRYIVIRLYVFLR